MVCLWETCWNIIGEGLTALLGVMEYATLESISIEKSAKH